MANLEPAPSTKGFGFDPIRSALTVQVGENYAMRLWGGESVGLDITEGADNVDCEGLFAYLDSRTDAFKSPTFQAASKLTLLRTCNMLLKRLSKVRPGRGGGGGASPSACMHGERCQQGGRDSSGRDSGASGGR